MPRIIAYADVLKQLQSQRMRCVYHNSGAFAFVDQPVVTVGWIGPEDGSIRAEMREMTIPVVQPYETTLAALARAAWQKHLPGVAWVMPKSHWGFELSDGSRDCMPGALNELGIATAEFAVRSDASAIEFASQESDRFETFVAALLRGLRVSDFAIAFPDAPVLGTIHHHKQLWWQTPNENLGKSLRALARSTSSV